EDGIRDFHVTGVQTCALPILMASFVWTADSLGQDGFTMRWAALAVTVVAGLLMVSRIRYSSFKGRGSGPRSDRVPFFVLLIAVRSEERRVGKEGRGPRSP